MINGFLSRCQMAVRSSKPFDVVLGNEGGDMDSVVGSIFLANFLSAQRDSLFVPVLNFPREDLPLRNDIVQLLKLHGVDARLLLSVCSEAAAAAEDAEGAVSLNNCDRLVLFDHNKLTTSQCGFARKVSGIVDHHIDEHLYDLSENALRLIATVGSASTLVEELYHQCALEVPQPALLLAPIVLDTMNFDPKFKKVTPRDEASRDRLMTACSKAMSINELYDYLNRWKFDISCLTIPETLRRDYKRFVMGDAHVGISSVLLLERRVRDLYSRDAWLTGLKSFYDHHKLSALLIMYAAESDNGNFTRELGVLCPEKSLGKYYDFATATDATVGLQHVETEDVGGSLKYASFTQRDMSVSRKGLTPMLSSYFSSRL